MASSAGAKLIVVNTRRSGRLENAVLLLGPAERVLPELVAAATE